MRKLSLLAALCVGLPAWLPAQTNLLPTQVASIKKMVEQQHIEPRPVNDAFSADFFTAHLDHLDPEYMFLTATDVKALEGYRATLDEELNSAGTAFFSGALALYKARMKTVAGLIETMGAKPFNFTVAESYKDDGTRAATEKELAARWHYQLKSDVLQSLAAIGANSLQARGTIDKAAVLAREPEARAAVKGRYLRRLEALQADEALRQYAVSAYLNAFLSCMDPHSAYFDPKQKALFERSVNSDDYYFGFALAQNDKGEVIIQHLQPGGAAWATGQLNKEDVLVRLKWAGKDPVELAGLSTWDVGELLNESDTEQMELTVRKGNGQQQTVVLQKRKRANEENIVKSAVLRGGKNIGYITLPSFYTEWEENGGSRCANDVATEVVKLKKDSIAGLILDLRFNGGGSLQEAVEMAGIFIDVGAICQLKTRDDKMMTLKDMNRGVIYSGPLLVLVNGQSASASELLAATLQDYNRALVVGSTTHGKASGQVIMPVEAASNTVVTSGEQLGFVKLTTSKLYRTTGKTAQKTGVQPHIVLPDPFASRGEREGDLAFSLSSDTVSAYKYFTPGAPLPVEPLKQKSAARLNADPRFSNALAASQAMGYEPVLASLKWDDMEKVLRSVWAAQKEGKEGAASMAPYTVVNNRTDAAFLATSEAARATNKQWVERLAKDIYIEEASLILQDYIQLK
ncbi:MAG TPA: carboxy terminal-processing peptidase [Chitinophagaceae bacterium]